MVRMRHLLPLATLALISCGDPSLEVSILVPDDYQAKVQSATLAVVVPPQGAPFTCDDVAFGAASDEDVRANTVEEIALRGQSRAELSAIPREEEKLLIARAFDEEGVEVVAGCTEYGLIDTNAHIQINGEVVTLASIPEFDPLEVVERETEVRITDVYGQRLRGISVRWTTTAPGLSPVSDTANSNAQGVVLVRVGQVPLPGPVAVDVRARWARSEPPIITGFRNPPLLFEGSLPRAGDANVRNPDEIYQVGRVGPNGEMGLVAMGTPDALLARTAYIAYYDTTNNVVRTQVSDPLPPAALSLALLTDGTREHIYTTTTTDVIEILNDGSLVSTPLSGTIAAIRRFLAIGSCSDPDAVEALLSVSLTGATQAIQGGQFVSSVFAGNPSLGTPIASGCVSVGTTLRRAVVYANTQDVTVLVDVDGPRQTTLPIVPAGVTFSQASSAEDALLLGTTLGIEGTDIVRYRMVPVDPDKIDVEIVTSDATPTFAQSTATGDFDGDGLGDVAAVLVFGDNGDATSYRIYMALGLESAGGRLVGITGNKEGQRPRIFVRDFDGDGHDDMLIGSNESYEVFSMGP